MGPDLTPLTRCTFLLLYTVLKWSGLFRSSSEKSERETFVFLQTDLTWCHGVKGDKGFYF